MDGWMDGAKERTNGWMGVTLTLLLPTVRACILIHMQVRVSMYVHILQGILYYMTTFVV